MNLNTLSPAPGSKHKPKRVGRGIGSTLGKTAGRGHKGQKARAGGFHKINFEGGQMPIQRRLPKLGFNSRSAKFTEEVPLYALEHINAEKIDMNVLYEANIIRSQTKKVKIILSGELKKAVVISKLNCTEGARKAIVSLGGRIEE